MRMIEVCTKDNDADKQSFLIFAIESKSVASERPNQTIIIEVTEEPGIRPGSSATAPFSEVRQSMKSIQEILFRLIVLE